MIFRLVQHQKYSWRFKISLALFVVINLLPRTFSNIDARGPAETTLQIKLDKMSPAYTALEDTRTSFVSESSEFVNEPSTSQVTLSAGIKGENIVLDTSSDRKIEVVMQDHEPLQGLRISQDSVPTSKFQVASLERESLDDVELYLDSGELKPLTQRKRAFASVLQNHVITTETVSQRAKRLIAEQLQEEEKKSSHKLIVSSTGNPIFVGQNAPVNARSGNKRSADVGQDGKKRDKFKPPWEYLKWKDQHKRRLVLSGLIEMTEGLGYTGSENILTVSRSFGGRTIDTGKVWVRDATFEISVNEAKGYLVAELHNKSGILLGSAEYDLSKLPSVPENETKVSGLALRLKPVLSGAIIRVISAYSYGQNIISVDGASVSLDPLDSQLQINDEGEHVERSLANGSTAVVRAQAKDHRTSLALITSGQKSTVRLLPEKMAQALVNIVMDSSEHYMMERLGIIWGQVAEAGKPLGGAQVEMAGGSKVQPVYFNELFIPDPSLKSTSDNGLFAYVGVLPGIKSVRATIENRQLPGQIIPVEGGAVSYLEIEKSELKTMDVRVADAFNQSQLLPATLRILGSDMYLDLPKGQGEVQVLDGLGTLLIETDSGESYEVARVHSKKAPKAIHFSMVRREWINGLAAQGQVNLGPNRGVIVGFVEKDAFEVFLNNGVDFDKSNIVYFDREGQLLHGDQGVPGGGFIMYNVEEGLHTITTLPLNQRTVSTQVVASEMNIVSIVQPEF